MNIEDIKAKARSGHIVARGGGIGGGRGGELIPGTEVQVGTATIQCLYHASKGDAVHDYFTWYVGTFGSRSDNAGLSGPALRDEAFVARILDRQEVQRRRMREAAQGYLSDPNRYR